nr:right-handed parallel beta-helix repeat-containing protein [uncultured Methanobacterium sp.]
MLVKRNNGKLMILVLLALFLFFVCSVGAVSAANVYNISNESYDNYFNESGYINDSSIQSGDVLDYSGTIIGKDMYIDRPLNITSSDKTGTIRNGSFIILAAGSGTNVSGLFISSTDKSGVVIGGSGCLVSGNVIVADPVGYAVNVVGSSNTVTHNYLYSNNGNKQGDDAVNGNGVINNITANYEVPYGSLISSTFFGGNSTDRIAGDYGNNVVVAPDGSFYMVGSTTSADLPVKNAADSTANGYSDVFVAHYSSNMSQLLACTYLGGSGQDYGYDIAVASDGSVYVTGYTSSADFPVNSGVYDNTRGGTGDVFVAKYNSALSQLLSCTYLGGSGDNDYGYGITVAGDGSVFVTGSTTSTDFAAVTEYGYQQNLTGVAYDSFVAKFDNTLSTLSACTYFGGSGNDYGYAVDTDGAGNVYITGKTASSSGFTTGGAFDTSRGGANDGFVAKFNSTLNQLLACTYFGGSGSADDAYDLEVGADGSVYIAGYTNSNDLPVTGGACDATRGGSSDGYVARLNTNLTSLLASTYYGGSGVEKAYGISVDGLGRVYICGYTDSTDLPTSAGAYCRMNSGGQDAFVACFNNSLSSLSYGSYYGGSGDDVACGLVLASGNRLVMVGNTGSANLPVKNAVDDSFNNDTDVFTSQWFMGDHVEVPVANFTSDVVNGDAPVTVHFADASSNCPTGWEWDFNGDGIPDSTQQNPVWIYNTTGNYTVMLRVRNSVGSDEEVKTGYITVNVPVLPVADFNATVTAAGVITTVTVYPVNRTVQFTDESSNDPTNWGWDFNNDGVVDSTQQNPTYVYSDPGVYSVTLTASNLAGSNTKTKVNYITVASKLAIYSTAESNANLGAPDSGIPGFVGSEGDGVANLGGTGNNYVNPVFKEWASTVVDYSPANQTITATFTNATKTLGPVTGDNFDIVSLGDLTLEQLQEGQQPGSITLGFNTSIANGVGADFVVFENGFISAGGAGVAGEIFGELGYVEVSTDGITFVRFPSVSLTSGLVGGYGTVNPTNIYNLVGKHCNAYGVSWGTPFNLEDLINSTEVLKGLVDLNNIKYVKIIDIPGCGFFRDADGLPIYDAWVTWGSGGLDLDAVGVINTAYQPVANFTADVTNGVGPLTVQFTDTSSGPTSWSWDFDGDGVIDSTLQNPSWTYISTGVYNVSLFVGNAVGNSTLTKTGFINVLGSVFNSRTNSSYVSIQGAIDDVSTLAGDIIIVNVGNYTENVVVNKNLVLSALGFVNISALNSSSPVFLVTGSGSGSTIAGFVISGGSSGICFEDACNCTIANNTLQNNQEGVLIQGDSDNNLVEGNVIRNSTWNGVLISGSLSNQNRIINSEISGNGQGITLSGAVNNLVLGNNVTGNGWAGIWLYGASNNVIGIFNVVSGNMEGIVLQNYSMFNNVTGNVIRDNAWNGVLVPDASSTGNRIVNNIEVSGNDVGIKLYYATLNVVEGNNVTGNDWAGIWLYNATYNTIGNANTVSGNQEGIVLQNNANNNVISGNIVRNNTWNGILVPDVTSNNNQIINNTEISGNNVGIDLFYAIGNSVQGNNVTGNDWAGIWVYNGVNNTITNGNTLSSNPEGIFIEDSSNIVVSGNSLVNNLRNGVYISNSSLVQVTGNGNISGNQVGVGLASSSNCQISNNTVSGNGWLGVWANNAHDSTIMGNLISANGQEGVLIENGAYNVTVSQNTIRNNTYHGIIVVGADNNTIDNNTEISGNNIGVLLQSASGNVVSSNLVTGSGWIGVCVLDTSLNNQVLSNNITDNPVGVRVDTDSSSNVVNNNSITGSQYGLTYAGTNNTLNATSNWWGSNDDPASQIHGNVNYTPWITH